MSDNLTALKQRAAEDQIKHAEAVKMANARRAIATEKLSIEMASLATSILVKHFGDDLAVANLTVSQEGVNRLVDVLQAIAYAEWFCPEIDFDFSVEGVHLSATAKANLTEKSYRSLRLFHDKREVSVEGVLAVLPPESKSAIALKTRLDEAALAEKKRLQELSDRRNREIEALKASIVESVKSRYGVSSADVEALGADNVSIVIDGKRFEAKVFSGAVISMVYAGHFVIFNAADLIEALDGTFDAKLAEAAKAEAEAAPTRQRRFFRR